VSKYALDTNVYIECVRNATAAEGLKKFLAANLSWTYMMAVVMQELRAGARTPEQAAALESGIFASFERRNRVIVPSLRAFKESGRILADVGVKDKVGVRSLGPSFPNDVLIAACCRETGITLITRDADYRRIARHLRGFRYISPPFPQISE